MTNEDVTMIKIDKLMLDDLVRLADGQIAKVVAILSGSCIIVEFETGYLHRRVHAQEKDIKPILLTKDILLEIGFRITGSFIELTEYVLNDADAEICVFYNRESNTPYFYAEIANVEVEMKYVHQLQHLLRMCGLNELADNLKLG